MRVLVRPQRGLPVLELKSWKFALQFASASVNFSAVQKKGGPNGRFVRSA
jgi:hypothetical protein